MQTYEKRGVCSTSFSCPCQGQTLNEKHLSAVIFQTHNCELVRNKITRYYLMQHISKRYSEVYNRTWSSQIFCANPFCAQNNSPLNDFARSENSSNRERQQQNLILTSYIGSRWPEVEWLNQQRDWRGMIS